MLNFYQSPCHLWKKLRTTNAIESCFVEVRRPTRPMVVFTSVQSVERIVYAIFNRSNEDWRNHTLELFRQRTWRTHNGMYLKVVKSYSIYNRREGKIQSSCLFSQGHYRI